MMCPIVTCQLLAQVVQKTILDVLSTAKSVTDKRDMFIALLCGAFKESLTAKRT